MSDKGAGQIEYAPAKDFYAIQKGFDKNGILRYETSVMSHVRLGEWKFYDEMGRTIKLVNEDLKFGIVKPCDIVEFIEKRGIFNRKTGESIFYLNNLEINGNFYRNIINKLNIYAVFKEDMENYRALSNKLNREKTSEKFTPIWVIHHMDPCNFQLRIVYVVDGDDIDNYIKEIEKVSSPEI